MLSFGLVELKRLTFISNLKEKQTHTQRERERERERVLSIIHMKFIQKLCKYLVNLSEPNFLIEICPLSVVVVHIFVFSSSPLGQFQPNLTQSILGLWEFKIVQMKGHALFKEEIITKQLKHNVEISKEIFYRTSGPISTKLATKHSKGRSQRKCKIILKIF